MNIVQITDTQVLSLPKSFMFYMIGVLVEQNENVALAYL